LKRVTATAAALAVAAFIAIGAAGADGEPPVGTALGGTTTRTAVNRNAFALPAAGLSADQLRVFFFGNRLFNTNWVIAPSSTESFDGLGPIFNRVSCSGCHLRDGRGQPPVEPGGPMLSMLVRLSLPGADAHGGPRPHPVYGDQLGDRAIPGVKPEGRAVLTWSETEGRFPDGERFTLRAPQLRFADLAYGPLGRDILTSVRVAPAVIGLGLLEAVPEATIRALADPEDRDGDGISGRVNMVWDIAAGGPALGRFGWKANAPNLRQQNAAAAQGDIGLTTTLFPDQSCSAAQAACRRATAGGTPEVSDEFLDKLTFYTQTLAVPARRTAADAAVRRGEALLTALGCAVCHRPTLMTGPHPTVPLLSNQTIHPFTDLLLHDMGEGLADGRPDFLASGREWRTPPLWGIGLVRAVNDHGFLLHDGRARGLVEAILWHGGEGEAARNRFMALPKAERDALIAFLESL